MNYFNQMLNLYW